MLSRDVKQTVERALARANDQQYEFCTLEHLLLALTQDPDAEKMLRACAVNTRLLRDNIGKFIDMDLASLKSADAEVKAKLTAGVERVVARAENFAKSNNREEATGTDVLRTLFFERESQAVYFLELQDMTHLDAINYINHGIIKSVKEPPQVNIQEQPPASNGTVPTNPDISSGSIEPPALEAKALTLSPDLQKTIERAQTSANDHQYKFCTLEHLLLALAEDPDAEKVLRACDVDTKLLRANLDEFINKDLAGLKSDDAETEAKLTAGVNRVLGRAAI